MTATAAERISERIVRRQLGVVRFSHDRADRFVAELSRFDSSLVARLASRLARASHLGGDPGPATTARLRRILAEVRRINGEAHRSAGRELRGWLRDFANAEIEGTAATVEAVLAPLSLGVGVVRPDLRSAAARVLDKAFNGFTLPQHVSRLAVSRMRRIEGAVRSGFVFGQTVDEIVRSVAGRRGVLALARGEQRALVRTSYSHVSSRAREELWSANADLAPRVEWVSTLDDRTTEICMGLDGKVFPVDEGPRPPAHFQCRSATVPVLASWRDLGIEDPSPGVRASMSGEVPASLKYDDWLRRQPAAVQDRALGRGKADLYRSSPRMTVSDLTDRGGVRVRTLKELERLFGAAS